MELPEEYELLGLFETQPTMIDGTEVPFFYNESTYQYINTESEKFTFSMCPSYDEVNLKVVIRDTEVADLSLNKVKSFTILSDNKIEKRIMLTGENYLIKIQFKPRFKIELKEDIEH